MLQRVFFSVYAKADSFIGAAQDGQLWNGNA